MREDGSPTAPGGLLMFREGSPGTGGDAAGVVPPREDADGAGAWAWLAPGPPPGRDAPAEAAWLVQQVVQTGGLDYVALEVGAEGARVLAVERHASAAGFVRDGGGAPTVPSRTRDVHVLALVHDDEQVGALHVAGTAPGDPARRRASRALVGRLTLLAHDLLVTARLVRALDRTVTAVAAERRRLRREVHDGVGPTVAAAALCADVARDLVRTDPTGAEEVLAALADAHRQVVADLRRAVEGLWPPELDRWGLVGAVRARCQALGVGASPVVRLEVAGAVDTVPGPLAVAAYRIAVEGLTNVVRHARAATCTVRLVSTARRLLVEVVDDGRGLGPGHHDGVGLTSVRERAHEVGARVEIGPGPTGRGTRLRCSLPLRG